MYKMAVMGDRDSIYGFAAVGLETHPVENQAEAAKTLRDLAQGGYAVIYITENYASLLQREIAHFSEGALPAIIPLPGVSGNTGIGIARVKKSVEQAVGSDIIFGGSNS